MMFLASRGRRLLGLAAAIAALAIASPSAQASFTYSVQPVTISVPFGGGNTSTLTIGAFNNGAASQSLSGSQIINLAQITQTSTRDPASGTDTTTVFLTGANALIVTVNNQNGGGTGQFTVTGRIDVTRSDTQGAISNFTLLSVTPSPLNLGSYTYTLGGPQYAAPTIQAGVSGNGSLSMLITEAVVPEPGSIALMGIGVALFAGLGLRRSLRRRAEQA